MRLRPWLATCALALTACSAGEPRDREISDGFEIAARRADLALLLATLEQLPESPVANGAKRLRSELPDCSLVAATAPREDPEQLLSSITCIEELDLHPALARRLRSAAVVFSFPIDAAAHLVGGLQIDADGNAKLEAVLTDAPSEGVASLFIPSDRPAGPARLSTRETLVHARMRPVGGLDLSRLVPEESQADQLFRLRSKLFARTALSGSWEIAMYRPLDGQRVPPIAIAADVAEPIAARIGLDQFIGEIEATWQVHAVARRFSNRQGSCFFDLRILPDFEPCFILSDTDLMIGWNSSAIDAALAQPDGIAPDLGGGFVIHLDRLADADEQLRRKFTPDSPAPTRAYPWTRFEGSAESTADGISIRASLRSKS